MSDFKELMQGLQEVESFLDGEQAGFKVHVPETIDVKQIRAQLRMTQARFSSAFGFSLDAIKHWEGGRRTPEVAARAYLTVIARNPAAVIEALGEPRAGDAKVRARRVVKKSESKEKALALGA